MTNLPKELRTLREEQLYRLEHPTLDLSKFLFDKQLAFVRDPHPFATAVCSRRSGKTIACAADLIDTAFKYKDSVCLYITLSRTNAKKILWPELQKINRQFNLGGKENHSELSMKFGEESIIYLAGANDKSEIEKFRGLKLRKAYIDESQSFPEYIQDLIDDVITPALMDYAGHLRLIGTPRPVPSGYFYECSVSENWAHHGWTFWDNPFVASKSGQSHQQLLDRELSRRGVSSTDPSIQREWFGKWSLDLDSLLLHYSADTNHFEELPAGKWDYLLGIDLGYVDADALAILAWSESHPATYLVHEVVIAKQDLTALVAAIRECEQRYSISKMVIDEGGLGKKLAEELRRRHQIPVQPADKARKMENVAFLNDALRSGRFKAKKNSRFAQDSFLVEIDRDKSTPDRIKVKDGFHSDIIDAVLYAFKESPAFTYQAPLIKPKYGTKEWAEEQVTEMEQKAQEYFENLEDATKGYGGW